MSALTWAALAIAAGHLARLSDNEPGRVCLCVLATFLLAAGLLCAPWGGLLS